MESKNVMPCNYNVLAEILLDPTEVDGVHIGQNISSKIEQHYYKGKVLKVGSKAKDEEQCPEVEEGMYAVFSDLAGYPVPTEDGFCKVVRGHDIIALISEIDNMNAETIIPTGQRILVEVIKEGVVKDGVYDADANDAREKATQKGVVISCAKGAEQFEPGTIVAFEPYTGNPIHVGDTFYKTINSFDIEFIIKK